MRPAADATKALLIDVRARLPVLLRAGGTRPKGAAMRSRPNRELRPRRTRDLAAALVAQTLIAGCAIAPPERDLQQPAVMLSVLGTRPVIDMRAPFRALFCDVLMRDDPVRSAQGCDEFLWHLPDEKTSPAGPPAPAMVDRRLNILIVGGAFGDCFPPESTPFVKSVEDLRAHGVYVEYVPVSGRSSSELNSRTIAEYIAATSKTAGHPLVLVGYSKGTADILETLARYSDAAAHVSAVVSFAGAVNGSPLAGHYVGIYDHLLSHVALGQCPSGNGGVLESLTRSNRLTWLANDTIPSNIRYFSVGTFTTPSRLARVLTLSQRQLSRIDPRNDGQLLAEDQLIPGSELLGYANADHWAVALRMEDRFRFWAHRAVGPHPFPQDSLLEAVLMFVQGELGLSAGD